MPVVCASVERAYPFLRSRFSHPTRVTVVRASVVRACPNFSHPTHSHPTHTCARSIVRDCPIYCSTLGIIIPGIYPKCRVCSIVCIALLSHTLHATSLTIYTHLRQIRSACLSICCSTLEVLVPGISVFHSHTTYNFLAHFDFLTHHTQLHSPPILTCARSVARACSFCCKTVGTLVPGIYRLPFSHPTGNFTHILHTPAPDL